jgi:hypothetical protein
LAELLGVSVRQLRRWLAAGGSEPAADDAARIRAVGNVVNQLRHSFTGPGVVAWFALADEVRASGASAMVVPSAALPGTHNLILPGVRVLHPFRWQPFARPKRSRRDISLRARVLRPSWPAMSDGSEVNTARLSSGKLRAVMTGSSILSRRNGEMASFVLASRRAECSYASSSSGPPSDSAGLSSRWHAAIAAATISRQSPCW